MELSFQKLKEESLTDILGYMRMLYEHEKIIFYKKAVKKALTDLINNETFGKAFLISKDEFPAGYIIITFGYSIEFKGKYALIDEFYIDEVFRGRGIGTEALKFAVNVCKKSGVKGVGLEVERENYKAKKLYKRSSFVNHNRHLMTKWIK